MEDKAPIFMKELWENLVSAQNTEGGIPKEFLEKEREHQMKAQSEQNRISSEIMKRTISAHLPGVKQEGRTFDDGFTVTTDRRRRPRSRTPPRRRHSPYRNTRRRSRSRSYSRSPSPRGRRYNRRRSPSYSRSPSPQRNRRHHRRSRSRSPSASPRRSPRDSNDSDEDRKQERDELRKKVAASMKKE